MPGETILVVEDESSVARGIEYGLKAEGYSVLIAATGKKALEIARSGKPQLILLDIRLPDLSGFDLAEMLGAGISEGLAFLVADEYRAADEIRALELDRTNYFCKPLDASWLCQWYAVFRGKGDKPSTTLERA